MHNISKQTHPTTSFSNIISFSAVNYAGASDSFADDYLTPGDFLIKNVTVIDGLGNKQKNQQDIFISGGKITAITVSGKHTPSSSAKVIDGEGLTATPWA